MSKTTSPPVSAAPAADGSSRRSALLAGLIGTLVGLIPLIPGAAFVLDPLLRKRKAAAGEGALADGFVPVTTLEAVPADGSPRAFPVIMDLQDAWNKFPKTEVGSVFLNREPDGGIKCFNCRCPHLGCTIGYADRTKLFVCPCHASSFKLDGQRNNLIPPRPMDTLAAEVRSGNEVWVKFENFRAGTAKKIVVG